MEKYEKIKIILREKDIRFEKKHKKDECSFSIHESNDYIIVYTRYVPFIKKHNFYTFLFDIPPVYNECYTFWNVFDKNENFIISIPAPCSDVSPIFLDKNNFILLKEDYNDICNYYHYKRVNNNLIACTFFKQVNAPDLLKINKGIKADNRLYNYEDCCFISVPKGFEILSDKCQIDNLFTLWKVNKPHEALTDLIIDRLIEKDLFCILKQISYSEENVSTGYNIIAFMDKSGNIISDLFYRKDNEILSVKIDKPINEIFDSLENECKEKVQEYIRKNHAIDISEEIIKKLEL